MVVDLAAVVEVLERIAPLRLAAEWDNVGLLIEGSGPVRRVAVCVDLTEAVLAEALGDGADLVLAYHPPLFRPVSRLTGRTPVGRVVLAAARAGVHVYSPHTALDAAAGGMTDWLIAACGAVDEIAPIEPHADEPTVGAGRQGTLREPAEVAAVIDRIKAHLGLGAVRVAGADRSPIRTVAVCPGAGGSVLERSRADLVLTGELRHHDVLARVAAGGAVVLTDHTHTERGYLPILARRLAEAAPELTVSCSRIDADPLRIR